MTNQSNDPDAIRADIEQTRSNLSQNVNALGEAVTPGNIARRQVDKVTGAAVGIKDKVMGSAESAGSSAGSTLSDAGGAVAGAPDAARQRTQGNPLAAGMIALGAGWLLGSLLPSSQKEREAAVAVKDQAQPVVDEAKAMAQQAGEQLKQPAQDAAESLKQTATEAVDTVKAEGEQAKTDVQASAQQSKANVQQHQDRPDTSM